MAPKAAGREAGSGAGLQWYERHDPEHPLLYKLVEEHYPVFAQQMAALGKPLPRYVQREFEGYLACGRLKRAFLRVHFDTCRACGGTLRIIACIEDPGVIEKILNHLNEKSARVDTHRLPETRAPPHQGSPEL